MSFGSSSFKLHYNTPMYIILWRLCSDNNGLLCYSLMKITILNVKLKLSNKQQSFFFHWNLFSFVWNSQRTGRSILQSQRKIFCLCSTQNQRSIMVSENLKWITIFCSSNQKTKKQLSFLFRIGFMKTLYYYDMIGLTPEEIENQESFDYDKELHQSHK